jgi:hypothetical protein
MTSHPAANDYRCLFFECAATNYSGVTYTEADGARHTVDFVRAHSGTFNPLWTPRARPRRRAKVARGAEVARPVVDLHADSKAA